MSRLATVRQLANSEYSVQWLKPRPDAALGLLARIRHTEGVVAVRNRLAVGEPDGLAGTGRRAAPGWRP